MGVLADQVLDRVLELGDQVTKGRFVRRVLRVRISSNSTPISVATATAFLDDCQLGLW